MSLARKVALFVVLAAAANVATVAALPWLINAYVMHRIERLAGGPNRALAAPLADASTRTIVRPSPDLLYTACVFDLAHGPLRITAPVQGSYVSVSGFAADTSNFFAISDADVVAGPDGVKRFDIVITRPGMKDLPAGARIVEAPSERGLILFRSLVTSAAERVRLQEFQARQECRAP